MNENIDLTKILKYCPKGKKLYSPLAGEVEFERIIDDGSYNIITSYNERALSFTKEGFYYDDACAVGECLLFPSKDQRDWRRFKAPWFNPETFAHFDKVIVRDSCYECWRCALYSHKRNEGDSIYRYATLDSSYMYCIPYNEDTECLVGTKDEPPEFYRYWED